MASQVSNALPRMNRVAVSDTLAVLFCPAANGKIFGVTIDLEDLPRVQAAGHWRVANFHKFCGKTDLYCYTIQKRKNVYLHRFLTSPPRRLLVDHIHHRTLDNRKSQLRVCTPRENQLNQKRYAAQRTPIEGFYAKEKTENRRSSLVDVPAGSTKSGNRSNLKISYSLVSK